MEADLPGHQHLFNGNMKTTSYNPSPLEVEFANALHDICGQLEERLDDLKINNVEFDIEADNPFVKFYLKDQDDDPHEVVIKIIQLPDKFD